VAGDSITDAVSTDKLMEYTEGVSRWVRLSGSEGEAHAFDYLEATLGAVGLAVERFQHDAFISWPVAAHLELLWPEPCTLPCITHAFALSTPEMGVEAEVVDAGTGEENGRELRETDIRDRVLLIDGVASGAKVRTAEERGARGIIFLNPPQLHEMSISTVWGSPTPKGLRQLPRSLVLSVRESDGVILRTAAAERGLRVRIKTTVDTRWCSTPLLVASLTGRTEDRYVLFSGHVDSWHYGVMDNGSANAVMVEMARIMKRRERQLKRGIRFAFWSGHSHGGYSGSTWYADSHWHDLHRHAVLHLNVDSAGGKGATVLSEAQTMAETWGSAARAIRQVTGQNLAHRRVNRMSDQSFWGIGVPSMFVDISTHPREEAPPGTQKTWSSWEGFRWGWWHHTVEDTIDKIDPTSLRRDAQIYALILWEWCTAPVLPLDYTATARELEEALRSIQESAGSALDLSSPINAAERLSVAVAKLNVELERAGAADGRVTAKRRRNLELLNSTLMKMGRALIPINYTESGRFHHDRVVTLPAIPLLRSAADLQRATHDSNEYKVLQVRLLRESNRVAHALNTATEAVEEALQRIHEKR
jgi:hypothetical protein